MAANQEKSLICRAFESCPSTCTRSQFALIFTVFTPEAGDGGSKTSFLIATRTESSFTGSARTSSHGCNRGSSRSGPTGSSTPDRIGTGEIQNTMASADASVLLISPDFLASAFVTPHEIPRLMELAEAGSLGHEEPDASRAVYGQTRESPEPVGSRPGGKGPFGTMDQAGNLWEWTSTRRFSRSARRRVHQCARELYFDAPMVGRARGAGRDRRFPLCAPPAASALILSQRFEPALGAAHTAEADALVPGPGHTPAPVRRAQEHGLIAERPRAERESRRLGPSTTPTRCRAYP